MNKFYSMLGIARKSGKVSIGYDAACQTMSTAKNILVIIAEDASEKTKKNIIYTCDKYSCKHIEYGEKNLLGKALGKAIVSVVVVNDENMISYLLKNI